MDTRVVSKGAMTIALAALVAASALAQSGWVLSHQKISDTEGGFTGILDDGDWFGKSVASLGDLDGDNVGDLVVGARSDDDGGFDRGAVWVLFLNANATVRAHQKISDTQGGFTGILDDSDLFGNSVSALGDLDGDGVGDVAVGAPTDDDGGTDRGAVWILFLNNDGTVKSHQKISSTQGGFTGILGDSDLFGWSVASLGDLDGDGVGDLVVGAWFDDDGGVDRGAVWVLFLNTDGTVNFHQKISDTAGGFTGILDNADLFGFSVASLGDFDGDSVGDLAVGAINDDDGGADRGAVWILFLNTNGTVRSHQKISDIQGGFTGTLNNGDHFGSSGGFLGDLDGDGVGDLAVGAETDGDGGTNRGAVWVLFLNTDGTVKSDQKISDTEGGFTGTLDNGDLFGNSVASLGDLDGDGVVDLAVGAPNDDDGDRRGQDRGAAWVLFLDGNRDIRPDSFSLFRGILTGGGLSDLFASDDSWMTVLPGITLNQSERQVQLIVTGTAPTETPTELKFRVEAHAEINNIGQWIELWNYDTNSYEQVDFMIATLADSIVEVSITTNPERFIEAGTKEMRAKVSYKEA
ncbi:MAG: FG-GAP repeat protein, partial [Armatimonadetes bacterium]|nr:FG-GAP repeat protein [Armatimonadota bacterium]